MTGAVDSRKLDELVKALEGDLVFTMSLGSKELFHSNVLAWFISRFPAIAKAVTGLVGPVTVSREEKRTDLLIRSPGSPSMVIENKIFALVDSAELDRIAKKFSLENPRLVVLSLTPPAWPGHRWTSTDAGNVWTWMSYDEFVAQLRPIVPEVRAADAYAGATLSRWLDLLGRLGELTELVGRPGMDEPVLLPPDQRRILGRLDAPVQKMRYQRVAAELVSRGLKNAYAGFTRATGLAAWFTDSPHGFLWGWQLQGEQFRLGIIVPKDHPGYGWDAKHEAARHEVARCHPGFFDFGSIEGAGPVGPKGNKFLNYRPDSVYKYVQIPGITIGRAIELGIECARRISQYEQNS
jgi:hypothetical protein